MLGASVHATDSAQLIPYVFISRSCVVLGNNTLRRSCDVLGIPDVEINQMRRETEVIKHVLDRESALMFIHLFVPLFMMLFFLEALRVFIGLVYFQNLSTMSLGLSVLYILLLLSPVMAPLFSRFNLWRTVLLTAVLTIIFRAGIAIAQFFSAAYVLVSAGGVVFFFGVYITLSIASYVEEWPSILPSKNRLLTLGVVIGVALDTMLRLLGSTWDLSIGPIGVLITCILVILATVVLGIAHLSVPVMRLFSSTEAAPVARLYRVLSGAGIGGVLFLCLSFLFYPNVVARWTESSFESAVVGIVIVPLLYVLFSQNSSFCRILERPIYSIVAGLFIFVSAVDLVVIHSPLAGLTSAAALFASFVVLSVFWTDLERTRSTLVHVTLLHTTAMATMLVLTVFYVLSLVGGQILPALAGLAPYLILLSSIMTVFAVVIHTLRMRGEVM